MEAALIVPTLLVLSTLSSIWFGWFLCSRTLSAQRKLTEKLLEQNGRLQNKLTAGSLSGYKFLQGVDSEGVAGNGVPPVQAGSGLGPDPLGRGLELDERDAMLERAGRLPSESY